MTGEIRIRDQIVRVGASPFDRGPTARPGGKVSVWLHDGGWLMAPNASLGQLDPRRLARFNADGRRLPRDAPAQIADLNPRLTLNPTKEIPDDHR